MCGIAGIVGSKTSLAFLDQMLALQNHRGPDHTGHYLDQGFAAIGHNRLSIIDLSSDANQPFSDASGRYQLSFNGEIYNYKELRKELKDFYSFRTSSDTEVLLASYIRWEEKCLEKLNGMFAFAIWDSKKKKLFAARDRFGVKPFYYSELKNSFIFASEIKSLKMPYGLDQPNEKVWANYFAFGSYGMPGETFYKDIQQLPAGHLLSYQDDKLEIIKWYCFEDNIISHQRELCFEEAGENYLDLLKDSIRLRFRSDVPIGFNISGGVDSSLLLSLVNQYHDKKKINAYTFFTGDKKYDELPWVEKMIAQTQNPLVKVKLTPEKVVSKLERISRLQDEPFGGIPTLAYAGIFERAPKDGIKVLLDGQGMDEQWAGYDYYFKNLPGTIQGTGKSNPFRTEVLDPDFLKLAEKPVYPEPFDSRILNLQYRDLFFTKLPRALRFNDRISMAYSTELREPFLDYRLVEYAFGLPLEFKKKGNTQKYLIRHLLKDMASSDLSFAPKRPLQTPQREWLATELSHLVKESIEKLNRSKSGTWFNKTAMDKVWEQYKNGDNQSSFHLWQWINTSLIID